MKDEDELSGFKGIGTALIITSVLMLIGFVLLELVT